MRKQETIYNESSRPPLGFPSTRSGALGFLCRWAFTSRLLQRLASCLLTETLDHSSCVCVCRWEEIWVRRWRPRSRTVGFSWGWTKATSSLRGSCLLALLAAKGWAFLIFNHSLIVNLKWFCLISISFPMCLWTDLLWKSPKDGFFPLIFRSKRCGNDLVQLITCMHVFVFSIVALDLNDQCFISYDSSVIIYNWPKFFCFKRITRKKLLPLLPIAFLFDV